MHFSRVNLQRDGVRKKCTDKSHCSVDILGAREKLKPATRGVWDWKWEMHSSCQRNKGGLWEASHGQAALERQQAQGEEKRGVLWSPEGEGAGKGKGQREGASLHCGGGRVATARLRGQPDQLRGKRAFNAKGHHSRPVDSRRVKPDTRTIQR